MTRATENTHFAWASVVIVGLIVFALWLIIATPQYSAEYTNRVEACVRGGYQWVEANCVHG